MNNGDPQQPESEGSERRSDTERPADPPTTVPEVSPPALDNPHDTYTADPSRTHAVPAANRVGHLPQQFGRYRVLKTLGEGGMGAVYLAEDSKLDRRVAIKVPFVTGHDESSVLDRFYREAKALAAIVHPNICPIHEVGQQDGIHFIAMTYVEGKSLSEYIRPEKPLTIRQALTLVHKLASALRHAHAAGVIHRDLKPANIIINSLKEPVIMDFGLARREGKADAVATEAGQMMGTPAYMPPEQFAGDIAAMGPGCDIYSLGVILYELLTSQRPFTGDVMALMSKIALETPRPPSQHRPEIDEKLDAICLRALAKKPGDRFASMQAFTEALIDYLKSSKPKKRRPTTETARASSRGGTIQAGSAIDEQSQRPATPTAPDPPSLATTVPEQREAKPPEPAPVEPAPVEPAPVDPAPVEPAPVDPAPVDPAPAAPAEAITPQSAPAAPASDPGTGTSNSEFPEAPAESTSAALLPVGEGYQLIKELGTGQYGEVWLGMAPGGIEVAIKKLLFPVGHKATQVELQALELMKRLRHSFLVQVQAYWVMEDQLMIVMELADGSLEDRLADCQRETGQGIPREELFGYIREAAEAIDFLHQEQVLHRDIKPGNILLVKGHVKVADFGIATSGVLGANQLTTTSATLGTPLYMGPELWNKQAGPRSDQYSLAVTYVELRLGEEGMQFDAQNRLNLSLLPENEQAVVGKALAPEPRDRYESCQQFSQALDDIIVGERRAVEAQRQLEIRKVEDQERRAQQAAIDQRRKRRTQLIAGACILACFPLAWMGWIMWPTIPLGLAAQESLTLVAGANPTTLTVTRVGDWGEEPFQVTIAPESLPPGVSVTETNSTGESVDVGLVADLQMAAAQGEITLVATANGNDVQPHVVQLKIQAAKCEQLPGWGTDWVVPSEARKIRDVSNKIYYDQVDRILPQSGTPVRLILIPSTDKNDCITFYCMRDKVSNRLFSEFAQSAGDQIQPDSQWRRGAKSANEQWLSAEEHPDLPVFGIGVEDAHAFANWLGGQLPNVRQWDTAAGFYDDLEREGPFRGPADGADGGIAIMRNEPLAVGEAARDVSYFGCRDMAGNGREWTRTLVNPNETFPVEEPDKYMQIFTRGRDYSLVDHPLRFDDLRHAKPGQASYTDIDFTNRSPIGFRCVVEFPAP